VVEPLKIIELDPIGFQLSEAGILAVAPRAWILEKLGIDPVEYGEPLPAVAPTATPQLSEVNDNLKNLTGKQMQGLMRIARKYNKGELTLEQALLMMATSFGLTEEQSKIMLGVTEEPDDV
jgi:hypothetical protein